jgi:hypothetical protein
MIRVLVLECPGCGLTFNLRFDSLFDSDGLEYNAEDIVLECPNCHEYDIQGEITEIP